MCGMQLKNRDRNEYGKCDLPENTVGRIQKGLQALDLKAEYHSVQASEKLYWSRIWIDDLQIVCEGKGTSAKLSEASAYAELAERFSAGLFYPVFEEQVRHHLPALHTRDTRGFLDFAWMQGYVQAHQDDLENPVRIEDLLRRQTSLTPADLQEIKDSPLAGHWVDGYSLLREQTVKVPVNLAAYIHGSNGMAAGNTLEEALIQAACEVFERWAQIQTIKPERIQPTIDRQSIDDPFVQDMIDFYAANKVEALIKDLSFGGLLPVIGVLYINHNLKPGLLEHTMLISGASFNTLEALSRCFTEGIQGRETLATPRPQFNKQVQPEAQVTNYYLLMRCGLSPKDISFLRNGKLQPYSPGQAPDLASEIEALKVVCHGMHTDCIILDQTHPVLGFPVVRVLMPAVSDFLPFLPPEILTAPETKPSRPENGRTFKRIMHSFFQEKG